MTHPIEIGTFTGDATITWDCSEFNFSKVGIFVHNTTEDFGGGTIAVEAGDGVTSEPVKITSKVNANNHSDLVIDKRGSYTIDITADELKFIMTGSTSPTVILTVFPRAALSG